MKFLAQIFANEINAISFRADKVLQVDVLSCSLTHLCNVHAYYHTHDSTQCTHMQHLNWQIHDLEYCWKENVNIMLACHPWVSASACAYPRMTSKHKKTDEEIYIGMAL